MPALYLGWVLYLVAFLGLPSHSNSDVHDANIIRSSQNSGGIQSDGNPKQATNLSFQQEAIRVQEHLQRTIQRKSLPLTAYIEAPLPPTIPGIEPKLPLRSQSPDDLQKLEYPQVTTCSTLPGSLPVHHPVSMDDVFGPNAGAIKPLYPLRYDYAKCCSPVDADPFLPWIHDSFVSMDGSHVDFVAHNKRRCRTDPSQFMQEMQHLEPQVALMQSVPVRRISEKEVQAMAPRPLLWSSSQTTATTAAGVPRYRLASLEDADPDGLETRFICRFHRLALDSQTNQLEMIILGETLSIYPYNYEHANYRQIHPKPKPILSRPINASDVHGAHNERFWNSVLHFRCPVPAEFQDIFRSGGSVVNDVPSIYLDLVPIRTRPRTTVQGYFPQARDISTFDPTKEWGDAHVLPTVEASGRWANVPICPPPAAATSEGRKESKAIKTNADKATTEETQAEETQAPHKLIGCIWSSASFQTRGNSNIDDSNSDRLLEWLTYHLFVAIFDHIYVYDNSKALSDSTTLKPVADLFPSDRVTLIDWPHRVCNNNKPANKNTGERSSQYAAETSCRLRYGPKADWMAFFDTDEYFIPQPKWSDLKHWLEEGVEKSKNADNTFILSFFQARAKPIAERMIPHFGGQCGESLDDAKCLAKRPELTFLETYDCETVPLPKPSYGWRAKKQIYRPWYVLNHYVHYPTVTKRLVDFPNEKSPMFEAKAPYERRVDEVHEAFMLHTKTTDPQSTSGWKNKCKPNDLERCPVGIVSPLGALADSSGSYNCYQHERVAELLPKLNAAMTPLVAKFRSMK
jgi:hypothetical protein